MKSGCCSPARPRPGATMLALLAVSLTGMALVVLIGALSVFLVQRTSRQREIRAQ